MQVFPSQGYLSPGGKSERVNCGVKTIHETSSCMKYARRGPRTRYMHPRGMRELFFSRSQNAGGEKILWTFHRNPSFESQTGKFSTYLSNRENMTEWTHFTFCSVQNHYLFGLSSSCPRSCTARENDTERERERERQRERGEKSALLKHGKEQVAAVSNTITLCISIFYLMSNTLGLLARVFSGKSSKRNVPKRD